MADLVTPARGLYRTTLPLPGKEQAVPAGRLVYFQEKSEQGPPIVVLPHAVVDNRWQFGNRGFLVEDTRWPQSLVKLPVQGYYTLKRELSLAGGVKLPEGLLVQLGYTQGGEPVAFPGQLAPENSIKFPSRGLKLTDLQLDALTLATFKLLAPPPEAKAPEDGEKVH